MIDIEGIKDVMESIELEYRVYREQMECRSPDFIFDNALRISAWSCLYFYLTESDVDAATLFGLYEKTRGHILCEVVDFYFDSTDYNIGIEDDVRLLVNDFLRFTE